MEETKEEQTMNGLEQPPTDFTENIQDIFDSIPLSVQNQYKKALTKILIEDDIETEMSFNILKNNNDNYLKKKERSKKSSKIKRDQNREVLMLLNKTAAKRGRPPKVVEEIKIEEEPIIEPLVEEDEPFKMEDLDDETPELELPPKPEYKPIQRSKKIEINHSLSSLFK